MMRPGHTIRSLGARACAAALVTLLLASCERKPQRPATPTPRVERTQTTRYKEEATARPVLPVEVPKGDPKSLAALVQALRGAPTPSSATDVPQVTSIALDATARGEARGLQKVGPTEHARLEEGAFTSREISLQPGDCVTGIAHGSLGVMEVDAFLLLADLGPNGEPALLAPDPRGGPIAVFGGAAGCYAFTGTSETACRFVVLARKGAGEVVFALYKTGAAGMPPIVTPPDEPTK
jgi:hypothetical protein